ncbi:MAG: phenylalanine--tRNA ligase subunit beta [Thermoplasmata archaeon M9B1D]|nr:MAG: phenylalanine--tRNA ligase subunit beta [Thermoplasmata archaeon M9B1D]PNX51631.1 MAG: phenylalanine--tRNA ligase subunit beta [Thermoplasmata archaeon M8B2D]
MPIVTFDYNDFINILGYKISKDELIEKLPMIGADLDGVEDDEISMEFFPDRPDLASVEGIVRASRAFFGFKTGLKKYEIKKSDIIINVDPSVKKVRPYVVTALVKNVTMTDELIASLMQLQEKLHMGLGRNRKKVAIGVHNFEPVQPPFTYKAVDPDSVQFVPLNKVESMTMNEILEKHEKGVDYAHLLKNFDKHPLIVDKNNNVLSYPPIINGTLTEVTPFTTNLFIDVTGIDQKAIKYALNIVTTSLAERGGQIYSTIVKDGNETYITPDLRPTKVKLSVSYVNKILGTNMKTAKVKNCIEKMGYDANENKDYLNVDMPAWRADILHEIDLVEDVAVGYGYSKFESDFPKALTFGKKLPKYDFYNALRNAMIGLGFNEVTTFTISNEDDEFKKMGLKPGKIVQFENPIGEEFSTMRVSLIPSLLNILSENRHHSLPQQIFELGIVVDEVFKNRYHLGFVKIDAKSNFTECKSFVEAIIREAGVDFKINDYDHPGFIKGRCASIIVNSQEIGFFGEIQPKTIIEFQLEYPVIAFEAQIDMLYQ